MYIGLGKTVQVVSFLDHLFEVEGIHGPFLISVPLSTIEHWKRETVGWSRMGVCLYHDVAGGRDLRDVIREFEWYYKGRSRRLLKFHVLVTTYDDLIRVRAIVCMYKHLFVLLLLLLLLIMHRTLGYPSYIYLTYAW